MRVAVIGASGFVGSSITNELRAGEATILELRAPRVHLKVEELEDLPSAVSSRTDLVQDLATQLLGVEVVINAAGNPDASSRSLLDLVGPNSALPLLILRAAETAGVARLIHVSSAVVQGDARVLDDSADVHPLTPYATSKAQGEELLREATRCRVAIYRPPSVHHESRRVSRQLTRLATSRVAMIGSPGNDPTPQALVENVAAAIAFLAERPDCPAIVHHPWEGMTTESLLLSLGGRKPIHIPRFVARGIIRTLKFSFRSQSRLMADTRRVEVVLLGQFQAKSWLTESGWRPPAGRGAWNRLGERVRG